ncbi:MAG TPA: lytic transglycosylase domain-containing protein [Xanthobacteraceae bacterium]|jgi:hypothetical protein
MTVEFSHTLSRRGLGRACGFLLRLLLSTGVAAIAPSAFASGVRDDPMGAQSQPSADSRQAEGKHLQNAEPKPNDPSTAMSVCKAIAAAAAANDLPADFFTRLIWRESHFEADAISRKGAQGIAQFMPATARLRGLGNPFDPLEAIRKSGELLRSLRGEFGNLGLAAAAYNAGSRRVHDWLGSQRGLPQETQAYVRFVTGHSVEEWAAGRTDPIRMSTLDAMPCNLPITASIQPKSDAPAPPRESVKPWDVEVVGGPTPALALARYREWLPKYAAVVADRKPHLIVHGILGEMGAVRVRIGNDTLEGAQKLCATLRKAGTYCDVLRNAIVRTSGSQH